MPTVLMVNILKIVPPPCKEEKYEEQVIRSTLWCRFCSHGCSGIKRKNLRKTEEQFKLKMDRADRTVLPPGIVPYVLYIIGCECTKMAATSFIWRSQCELANLIYFFETEHP